MPNKRREGWRAHGVAFPDDLWRRAQARADRDGVKVSAVVRAALEEYVPAPEKVVGRCPEHALTYCEPCRWTS